jgi:hypothetical protein
MNDYTEMPEESIDDKIYKAAKAISGLIPPLPAIIDLIFVPPIKKRNKEWRQSIAAAVQKLAQEFEEFKIESLKNNENFITKLITANIIAVKTHQKEKLDALKNAVLNSVLPYAPNEDLQTIILNLIDRYTTTHINLLKVYYDADKEYLKNNNPDQGHIIRRRLINAFPDFMENINFYWPFFSELLNDNLLSRFTVMRDSKKELTLKDFWGEITPFGKQFIEFIKSPLKD